MTKKLLAALAVVAGLWLTPAIALAQILTINDVTVAEGNTGTTAFTFTVSLSSPAPAGGVTFDIGTVNGTALAGSDYTAKVLTGQTIAAGNSTYTFTVDVTGDTVLEANETFLVNVTNVTVAPVLDPQGLGTIVNDDTPTPVPTLSEWAMILFGTILAGGAALYIQRRRQHV